MATLNEAQIDKRKLVRSSVKESFRLEGIEFTGEEEAMFQLFDQYGWDADTCVKFFLEYRGIKKAQ